MTNKKLREDLLKKLGVTPQALSQQVQKLKKSYAITTEEATYVIAQREGIILDKYLDKDNVKHVRGIMQQLAHITQGKTIAKLANKDKSGLQKKQLVVIFPREFTVSDPILEKQKILEAKDMAAIYPLLYVLENSIRKVIDRFMTNRYGSAWWDEKSPKNLKKYVKYRMADEEKNSWHQKRGSREIDYLDLKQLPELAKEIEKEIVPSIIPDLAWFEQFINEVYKSRCVVCHMNPLDKDNIQAVKLRFRQWQKHINTKTKQIPELIP